MSTNLEYRAREIRWQASEGQREKGRQRSRVMDKKFFFEEQHENFVLAVTKWEMLAANKQMQGEHEGQWKKANL